MCHWVTQLALGLYVVSVWALCGFSVYFVLVNGVVAAWQPASWVSRLLFWWGVFVIAALMLSVVMGFTSWVGREALRGG